MKKKIVLVISISWEQQPLIELLSKREDIELFGLHYPGKIPDLKIFKKVFQSNYRDMDAIGNYIETIKPDAIISDEDDYGMFLQAFYSEKYNLPGPRIKEAQIACNKFLQRTVAKEHGINIPKFQLCSSSLDVINFVNNHSFPIILKPIDSRGSIGVTKINSFEDIQTAFFKAIEASPSLLCIVEQFIEGSHFNVDGYCFQNEYGIKSLAVSENIKADNDQGLVNTRIVYGKLNRELNEKLKTVGESVAKKLGYKFGFFHGEFIICNKTEKIYLTEMANRGGGILISEVILPFVTDTPLLEIYISDCLGEKFTSMFSKFTNKYASIEFVNLEIGKKFRPIDINQFDNDQIGLLQIVPFLSDGEIIKEIEDGSKRHVMFISNIENNEYLERLKIKIKKSTQE